MNLLIILVKLFHLFVCVSCFLYFREISIKSDEGNGVEKPEIVSDADLSPTHLLGKSEKLVDSSSSNDKLKKYQRSLKARRESLVYVPLVDSRSKTNFEEALSKVASQDGKFEAGNKNLEKVLNNYPVEQTIMDAPRIEYLTRMRTFSKKTKRSNPNQDVYNDALLKLIGIASLYGSLAKRSSLFSRNHNTFIHPNSTISKIQLTKWNALVPSPIEKVDPDVQRFMQRVSKKKVSEKHTGSRSIEPLSCSIANAAQKLNCSNFNETETETAEEIEPPCIKNNIPNKNTTNNTLLGSVDILHVKINFPKNAIDANLLHLLKSLFEDSELHSNVKVTEGENPVVHLKDSETISLNRLNELLQKLITTKHSQKRSADENHSSRRSRIALNNADVSDLEKIVSFLNDIRFNKYGALFADDVPTPDILLNMINMYRPGDEKFRRNFQAINLSKGQKSSVDMVTGRSQELFGRHSTSTEPEPDDDIDGEQKQFSSSREYEERPKNSRIHKVHHTRPITYARRQYKGKPFSKTISQPSKDLYDNEDDEDDDSDNDNDFQSVENAPEEFPTKRPAFSFKHKLHKKLAKVNEIKENNAQITTTQSPDFEALGWTDSKVADSFNSNQEINIKNFQEFATAEFLIRMNKRAEISHHREALAEWKYECDMSKKNGAALRKIALQVIKVDREIWTTIKKFSQIYTGNDPFILRQFQLWSVLGEVALPKEKYLKLQDIVANMTYLYSTVKLCPYNLNNNSNPVCTLKLEPDLTNIMANNRDPKVLLYYWNSWRERTGRRMKPLFENYVSLMNDMAHLNNFSNAAEYWLHPYESPNIETIAEKLWLQIKPLYDELHYYVRFKLRKFYGVKLVPKNGPIPAHLFGNMWAQTWSNLYDIVVPYPKVIEPNLTERLKSMNFSARQMFITAEEFFTSLGLEKLPKKFWTKSVLEAPKKPNVKMVCHASAWDMYNRKDFRIKMCTDITKEDFIIIHHEMGHVYYFIQYKNQPFIFRDGANPGFHEAIGDTIALSVGTRQHLQKLNLLMETAENEDNGENHKLVRKKNINFLLEVALEKIAFLPFGYLIDKWRWDIFKGKVQAEQYNDHWWKLRIRYQNIGPPNQRSIVDFDPGSKFHVAANVPYFRYFISFIIQFQFYKSLCIKANQYEANNTHKLLHQCDFYENKNAGRLLKSGLGLGRSKPWPYVMKILTGTKKISARAINEYFEPLKKWLIAHNKKHRRKKPKQPT